MSLKTEIITDGARLEAVRLAWQGLWDRADAYIFQHHGWIAGWFSGMAERRDVKLLVAVAWDGETLCGVMPCAVHRRSGLRMLTWAAQLFSDYCDCLIDPGYEAAEILSLLWDSLNRAGGFDLVSLQQVRPDAKGRMFLDQLAGDGRGLQFGERTDRCMRIENRWPDGEAFFRSLNKKGRNNHTRGKRILAELGGDVVFRSIEPGEDVAAALDEIMRLKEIWLRANDPQSTLLGHDAIVLRAILERMWQTGLVRIFLLESGGSVAAASVNFVYAGRMEAYFTAYDARFDRASPGTILIVDYARWSFDRRFRHVDFLRGEEAFKFRMANAETLLSSFSGARTFVGQVAVSGHRWLSRRRHRQEVVAARPDDELETAG